MKENIKVEPQLSKYLFSKAARNFIPLGGTFELLPFCNFNCKMCYVRMSHEDVKNSGRKLMSYNDWISLAKEAKKAGMLYLLLTGGEPFIYPRFKELLAELTQMGFVLSINSNGSLIDEEVIRWLKDYSPARINITLYGASNETYELLTGQKNAFDKVVKAIDLLLEAGILVKLNCSLTPYNAHDLEKMIQFANDKNLIIEITSYMFPPVRKSEENIGDNARFSAEEFAKYRLKSYQLQYGNKMLLNYAQSIISGVTPCASEECMEISPDGTVRCRAGKAVFWVTWDGRIQPCGLMVKPYKEYEVGKFESIWKKINIETSNIRLSGVCNQCNNDKVCHVCCAMAYAETGKFEGTPTYLCDMVKALRKYALKILYDKSIIEEE